MKKFIFVNPFGIGDVLFTTPVIRAIRDNYPDAFIGYWCNERVEGLLKNNPHIDKIFAFSMGDFKRVRNESVIESTSKLLKLLWNIKREKFEICLDFSSEHRYSLLAKILGIKRRVGFNYKNRGRFLTDKIDTYGYSSKHVVEYYLDLLKPLGITPKDQNLELKITEINRAKAQSILTRLKVDPQELLIGIAPGAGGSWGKDAALKHWPAIKYAQLAQEIVNNFKCKILLLGDEPERPIADIISAAVKGKVIDLVGKTSLEELTAVIENLNILITNDGGPLHIAIALGVKTVSIFGPVDDLVYGPYPKSAKHIVIKEDVSCQPCYQDFKTPICDKDRECLKNISVDRVSQAVRSLI